MINFLSYNRIMRLTTALSNYRTFAYKSRMSRSRMQQDANENSPKFSAMIRQLYRRSHPDLLRASHLEYSIVNDQSMQVLNGVLSTVKRYNEFPPRIVKRIPFYMKTAGIDTIDCVHLNITTAGGDSKKQITRTFEEFFTKSGISTDGKFVWDKEYFPTAEVEHHAD